MLESHLKICHFLQLDLSRLGNRQDRTLTAKMAVLVERGQEVREVGLHLLVDLAVKPFEQVEGIRLCFRCT